MPSGFKVYMSTVTVYSKPSCHFCHMAKEYFAANNVPFTDFNVAEDNLKRQEMITKSGQMGVPVIIIDNNLIVGFNKPKIAEILGIKE